MKHRAFTKKNHLGFWVGCIEYPNGVVSEFTNAKYREADALEIVERVLVGADERWEEMERRQAFREAIRNGNWRPTMMWPEGD